MGQKNIPALRFKGFTGEWEEEILGNLLEFKNGINATGEQYGSGIKYISILDIINNNEIYYDDIIGLVDVDEKIIAENSVVFGDLIFVRSSETTTDIGHCNVYMDREKPATFGGFVIRGKPIKDFSSPFLNKCLKSDKARKETIKRGAGAQHYNIGQTNLAEIPIFKPEIKEQQKVASFFTLLDEIIDTHEKLVEHWEQIKKGYMQKIFNRELRFYDENGKPYPEWEEKRLGEVAEIIMGQSPSSSNYNDKLEGLPLIQGKADLANHKLVPQRYTVEGTKETNIGDIVLTVRAPVGYVAITGVKAIIGRGVAAVRAKKIEVQYLFYCLLHSESTWISLQQGSTFTSVNSVDIEDFTIFSSTLKEQQKIANFLSAIDKKIEVEKEMLEHWRQVKKGYMQKMFV